jgi:hypothetical protein
MATQLRLYRGPDDVVEFGDQAVPEVHISLRDLLPLVAMAQRRRMTWLQDFLDDEVAISSDLHEVLLAIQGYRPSA